jgi:hypothetical protein
VQNVLPPALRTCGKDLLFHFAACCSRRARHVLDNA